MGRNEHVKPNFTCDKQFIVIEQELNSSETIIASVLELVFLIQFLIPKLKANILNQRYYNNELKIILKTNKNINKF